MKKKLVFATNNPHKLDEVTKILSHKLDILSLKDIGCHEDIPETADTIEGNALLKANFVKEHFDLDCFADDTGLEIAVLNNEPGVYSARYAGEDCIAQNNMQKVLKKMEGMTNRKACFITVIALIYEGQTYTFEGKITGTILTEKRGDSGFGYDPIFMPDGYTQTFAELGEDIKNKISHRAIATNKLFRFLETR